MQGSAIEFYVLVTFPDSPFRLNQLFAPAGDSMRWRSVLVGGGAVPPGAEQRTSDLLSSWATNRELAAYADAKPLNERALGRSARRCSAPEHPDTILVRRNWARYRLLPA